MNWPAKVQQADKQAGLPGGKWNTAEYYPDSLPDILYTSGKEESGNPLYHNFRLGNFHRNSRFHNYQSYRLR
jgi:hypothetical protein